MAEFNQTQEIKRRFFAMRNGIVADTIRKGGLQYKMVFGLNLPQIIEIADGIQPSRELAEQFWADTRTRESMLLAPMIYPRDEMTRQRASEMLREVTVTEVADILCHRLLRHLPFAMDVAVDAVTSDNEMERYGGFRLMFNLLYTRPAEIKPFAEAELASNSPLTHSICKAMLDEIEFLEGE
ncbi:hypothetical protein [uncultured Duncaniella sp.]|uniref:hypothetical protein n=1 Tax=uncultured Duncaniella sp. TaxID=2768039 RepID=UPI0025F54A66|nr:hypothetical protein [uncultured Duncaniella sp.]